MTSAPSVALTAMREAEQIQRQAMARYPGDARSAREYAAVLGLLQIALAHAEAELDPRIEVVAASLDPAAFDGSDTYTPAQAAESQRCALADARRALVALDAFEAGSSRTVAEAVAAAHRGDGSCRQ
jgi:hypothetical protein